MDNDNIGNFALGIIVAVVVFLLWRREFHHGAAANGINNRSNGAGAGGGSTGGCGCGGGGSNKSKIVSIGGESYSAGSPFDGSSVVSTTSKENLPEWLESVVGKF